VEYHKINAPFKRDDKGKMLHGEWCLKELEYLALLEWEFTEKVDGTNIRLYFDRDGFWTIGGRTNNAQIPKPLLQALSSLCENIKDKVRVIMEDRKIDHMVIYGEGYGPRINGGGKYSDVPEFVAFDIKVGDFWLLRNDVDDFCMKVGLESVPVLGRGTLYDGIELVKYGCIDTRSGGKIKHTSPNFNGLRSMWGDFEAEGVIAVPAVPLFDRAGRRIITKIKARDFRSI
jgi:hypothetical protein